MDGPKGRRSLRGDEAAISKNLGKGMDGWMVGAGARARVRPPAGTDSKLRAKVSEAYPLLYVEFMFYSNPILDEERKRPIRQ